MREQFQRQNLIKSILFLGLILIGLTGAAAQEGEIQAFTEVGEHTWEVPPQVDEVDVLVVGGGGGGGATRGSGGGAGAAVFIEDYDVSSRSDISLRVGDGGSGGFNDGDSDECQYGAADNAENGSASEFAGLEASGGGAGAPHDCDGHAGGSGGGAGTSPNGASGDEFKDPGAALNTSFGKQGGESDENCGRTGLAGGGGGAGEKGTDSVCSSGVIEQPGDGGDGIYFGDVFGEEYGEEGYFAGGGGGGHEGRTDISGEVRESYGGLGGGGDSAAPSDGQSSSANGEDGQSNTGGGGGGGNYETGPGGDGGSGIVLVKYQSDFRICDLRGLFNECISNSTHDVSGQSFDIDSVFEAEQTSVFEAFEEKASISVSNSSIISGVWRGGINIESEKPRIEAGAEFRPEGERIVIGK